MTIKIIEPSPRHKLRKARDAVANIEIAMMLAEKPPSTLGHHLLEPQKAALTKLVEMEMEDAMTMPKMIRTIRKYNKKHPIPIICCPDGGAVLAEGFSQGLERNLNIKSTIFSREALEERVDVKSGKTEKEEIAPDYAVDMAVKSGVLLIADSAIDGGGTIKGVIESLQQKLAAKYPQHKHIKVIVAANVMYADEKIPQNHIESPTPEMAKAFGILSDIIDKAKPVLDIEIHATDICSKHLDVQNRGDFFAVLSLSSVTDMAIKHLAKREVSVAHPHKPEHFFLR